MLPPLLIVAAAMPAIPAHRSTTLVVRLQVVEACTIGRTSANCRGAQNRPPVVTRAPDGALVYTF
jgi:hypothetical protein